MCVCLCEAHLLLKNRRRVAAPSGNRTVFTWVTMQGCRGSSDRRRASRVCCLRGIWRSGHRDATLYTRVTRLCAVGRACRPPSLAPSHSSLFVPLSSNIPLVFLARVVACAYARVPRSAFNSPFVASRLRSRCDDSSCAPISYTFSCFYLDDFCFAFVWDRGLIWYEFCRESVEEVVDYVCSLWFPLILDDVFGVFFFFF